MKILKDDLYCVVTDKTVYLLYAPTGNHAMARVLENVGNLYPTDVHCHQISFIFDDRLNVKLKQKG